MHGLAGGALPEVVDRHGDDRPAAVVILDGVDESPVGSHHPPGLGRLVQDIDERRRRIRIPEGVIDPAGFDQAGGAGGRGSLAAWEPGAG